MAIRYKALTELYQETQRSVTAPDQWRAFLASACRNYRLSFDEQLLVYAQRPDATAVLEIERWNRQFGRWVNRGANGIAVFDGEHNGKPRLKYYFDISDTHEARLQSTRSLWFPPCRNLKRKADMFTRRTIRPHVAVTSVDTASEALAVSISEKARVDMDYMAELSGKSPEELEKELAGVIYRDIRCAENPEDILPSLADLSRYPLVTADEYLSGKVRQKLRMAKAFLEVAPDNQKETARRNVEALEAVQPQDLGAGEIGVRIGANWVPIEVYQQFMVELAEPALTLRDHPQIIDLISVLEQSGLQKQKEEVQALVGYIDGMEEKLSQMMDEMKEMRLEVGKLHDKGIRARCSQLADTVEGKVRQTKVMVSTAKENLISSAKQMVQTFREKGRSALCHAAQALHIPSVLSRMGRGLGFSFPARIPAPGRPCRLLYRRSIQITRRTWMRSRRPTAMMCWRCPVPALCGKRYWRFTPSKPPPIRTTPRKWPPWMMRS